MEHLESFEAAAASIKIDPAVLPGTEGLLPEMAKAIVATYKLFVISKASWSGNKIDWSDWRQKKYYNWFNFNLSGSPLGFSSYDYYYEISASIVGSRLVFPSSEISRYVAEKHVELYRDMMVIEQ